MLYNINDILNDLVPIVVPVAGMLFVLALVYIKRKPQWDQARRATDQQAMAAMMQTAQRLETRVIALEQILDAEVPNWRSRL